MRNLSKLDHIKVLILFTVISIAATYPLIFNMNNISGIDDLVFVNAFWWFKKAINSFKNPFFTDFIFLPKGTSLVFLSTTFSNFLLTLPISILLGVNSAVNAAYLLALILSGYTTFLLAFELTANKKAAVIAGLIFAFNPFHIAQGRGHLHVSTLQWIPLFLLFYKRAVDECSNRWAIWAGAVFGLIILTDQIQTISTSIVVAISIPFILFSGNRKEKGNELKHKWKRFLYPFMTIALTSMIVSGYYLFETIKEIIIHPGVTKIGPMDHGGANTFSGDLLGYFLPINHLVFGRLLPVLHGENILFFGYIPLTLAVIGVVMFRRNRAVGYISLITLIFWALSLGTYLHINGQWEWDGRSYPLPFLYLTNLPLIGDIRTPSRFHMITILGISILAAFGSANLMERWGHIKTKVLFAAMAGVILFEYLPNPQNVDAIPTPAIYKEMAKDKEPYTVLYIPLARWSVFRYGSGCPAIPMYYQTIHEKKIFNAYLSRARMEDLIFKDPILDLLVRITTEDQMRIAREKRDPSEDEMTETIRMAKELKSQSKTFFNYYNIKYVVMHAPLSGNTLSKAFIEEFTGMRVVDVPEDNMSYLKVY